MKIAIRNEQVITQMGPKKEPPKGAAGAAGEEEGLDPAVMLANYQKLCKFYGIPINQGVSACLTNEEKMPITQLFVDNEYGILGSGGTRALMGSLLGVPATAVKGGPYKLIQSIRLWRCHSGDDGAAAIAEVLRLGGAEVRIHYLELLDNDVGIKGAQAIGMSLSKGKNLSLMTLKLDYNKSIGTEGCINLCRGIKTNQTLKQLHLCYCQIGFEAGEEIGNVLKNQKGELTVLNLQGNKLRGYGFSAICDGLRENAKLETLILSDNYIDGKMDDSLAALHNLNDVLQLPTLVVASLDLSYNLIGEDGANIIIPGLESNKTVKDFYVDASLPVELFEKLFRDGGGGGKKGKGKKKK